MRSPDTPRGRCRERADDFDVETFPSLLIVDQNGTYFLGPLLPRSKALARLPDALGPPLTSASEVSALLAALAADPEPFALRESR